MNLTRNILLLSVLAMLGACSGKSGEQSAQTPPAPVEAAPPAQAMADETVATSDDPASLFARTCASCHGKTAEGVGDFPSLVKLDRATIQARLEAYRAGTTVGPKSAIMTPITKNLSDEQIAALASYLGS